MKGSSVFIIAGMLLSAAACGNLTESDDSVFLIEGVCGIDGLHAPWDGLDDSTSVKIISGPDDLYFLYEVRDTTVTLTEDFSDSLRDKRMGQPDEISFCQQSFHELVCECSSFEPKSRKKSWSL